MSASRHRLSRWERLPQDPALSNTLPKDCNEQKKLFTRHKTTKNTSCRIWHVLEFFKVSIPLLSLLISPRFSTPTPTWGPNLQLLLRSSSPSRCPPPWRSLQPARCRAGQVPLTLGAQWGGAVPPPFRVLHTNVCLCQAVRLGWGEPSWGPGVAYGNSRP